MAVEKTVFLLLVIMSPDVLTKEQPARPGGKYWYLAVMQEINVYTAFIPELL